MNYFGKQPARGLGDTIIARYAYPGLGDFPNPQSGYKRNKAGQCVKLSGGAVDKSFCETYGVRPEAKGDSKLAAGAKGALTWLLEPFRPRPPSTGTGTPPPQQGFFQAYKTPIIIGGATLVAIGAVYAISKKKKRS